MIDKFIGIPYEHKGKSFAGADCVGLVELFNKEVLGRSIPDFSDLYLDPSEYRYHNIVIESQKSLFEPISEPTFGDIILFRIGAYACHLGIFIDESTFLHSHQGHDSAIQRIDSHSWSKRIIGFFRLRGI
jgi:cell wall-associated NlpC family hydrolase